MDFAWANNTFWEMLTFSEGLWNMDSPVVVWEVTIDKK